MQRTTISEHPGCIRRHISTSRAATGLADSLPGGLKALADGLAADVFGEDIVVSRQGRRLLMPVTQSGTNDNNSESQSPIRRNTVQRLQF